MSNCSIAVFTDTPDLQDKALALATSLKLPLAGHPDGYAYLLILTPNYLGIQKTETTALPLYIDFLSKEMRYRRTQATSPRHEMLARAVGLSGKKPPQNILDATAGLGRDSFRLACFGCHVTLMERSPIIHALLQDGINRAKQDSSILPIIDRLHLLQTDALAWIERLETISPRPDVIYLDPMFPTRTKSALPKKEMLIFHDIVGNDSDADTLLTAALACGVPRVVVKRPRLANYLGEQKPTFSLTGSSSRFDVYIH